MLWVGVAILAVALAETVAIAWFRWQCARNAKREADLLFQREIERRTKPVELRRLRLVKGGR